jgi:hypothetical protein
LRAQLGVCESSLLQLTLWPWRGRQRRARLSQAGRVRGGGQLQRACSSGGGAAGQRFCPRACSEGAGPTLCTLASLLQCSPSTQLPATAGQLSSPAPIADSGTMPPGSTAGSAGLGSMRQGGVAGAVAKPAATAATGLPARGAAAAAAAASASAALSCARFCALMRYFCRWLFTSASSAWGCQRVRSSLQQQLKSTGQHAWVPAAGNAPNMPTG